MIRYELCKHQEDSQTQSTPWTISRNTYHQEAMSAMVCEMQVSKQHLQNGEDTFVTAGLKQKEKVRT